MSVFSIMNELSRNTEVKSSEPPPYSAERASLDILQDWRGGQLGKLIMFLENDVPVTPSMIEDATNIDSFFEDVLEEQSGTGKYSDLLADNGAAPELRDFLTARAEEVAAVFHDTNDAVEQLLRLRSILEAMSQIRSIEEIRLPDQKAA